MRKAGELGTKQLYNTQLLPLDREYYVQKKSSQPLFANVLIYK